MILSLLFSQFVEDYIFQNKVTELNSFGEQILTDLFDHQIDQKEVLITHYDKLLNARNIRFLLFDDEGTVIYPELREQPSLKLTQAEWGEISQGKTVKVKHDIKRFGQEATLVAVPHMQGKKLTAGILLISPITGSLEMISQLNKFLLYTIAISLVATLLLSLILSKNLVRRIKQIQKATSMISAGNYDVHIPSTQDDEIGELVHDFNHMVEKLQESNEEIQRLENRRRKFIADVSHELRTPLTTISGLLEGLKNDLIPENEKGKSLDLMDREAKRLIRLVNENLDYEKIRSNQLKLNKFSIQLLDVFELVQDQLSIQANGSNSEIMIDVNEEETVFADYDRLVQILMNITKNSIQFTKNGTIWLRGLGNELETIIEIEDTGIGIDPSEIESIWLRFYKADLSRTNNEFGEFGLGLSIVKQLVQLHNGTIEVTSEKGNGTKFTILLPKQVH